MNELTLLQNTPTMSSREIAELCDKEHRNVCRDIRAYVGAIVQMERGIDVRSMDWDGKEGVELFEHTPIGGVTMKYEVNPQNKQTYPVYYLDKNATLTIITGYSILFRKRIIDRWQELEKAISLVLPDFSNPAEAARAWAAEFEKREQAEKAKIALEQQASINAPKVAHYDRVVARTNLVNATHVASKLKLSAVKLNRHLCELGVYNQAVKRGKVFNTWFIDKGYGEMKQTELGYDQALFTHAGEMWVIEMMISEGVVG